MSVDIDDAGTSVIRMANCWCAASEALPRRYALLEFG
jgi:hypothetical protein